MEEVQLNVNEEANELLPLLTPGEFLHLEYLAPLGITPYRLAKDIAVDQGRIEAILDGRRTITLDTAIRLSRYFATSPAMWLNLQATCDLRKAERDIGLSDTYNKIAMHPAIARALSAA